MRLRTLLLLVALVVALGAIMAQASAQNADNADNRQPRGGAEPSKSISTRTLQSAHTNYATVNFNGTLAPAQSLGAVSATRVALGRYEVIFDHNVTACAYNGTIGQTGAGLPPSGEISLTNRGGNVNGVFVRTFASNGVEADRGFFLSVHCRG